MPRRGRCILPGVACHITQRGVDRRETFSSPQDHSTYLRLLRENLPDAGVRVLAYCLMTNHVHLIAVPEREDSLAVLSRRVHGRYAQYYNTRCGRSGHLWQNRFFACVLARDYLWTAIAYVERNPVRAGMVLCPADYPWSSAAAHLAGVDANGVLDIEWWRGDGHTGSRGAIGAEDPEIGASLRRCTYSGRPFGSQDFVNDLSGRFGRYWTRGRPPEKSSSRPAQRLLDQFSLFAEPGS